MPLLAARVGDDDTQLDAAARATTTTEAPTTTAPPEVAGVTLVAEPAPATSAPATTAPAPTITVPKRSTPTTAAPACRNSTDPRCGPFRWDPPPRPNDPVTASMSYTPTSPRAGQQVFFVLRATDPDAPDVRLWSGPCVTPNPGGACDTTPTAASCDPHGPWTPPAERPLDRTERYTVIFSDPGTYRVTFTVHSQSHACPKLDPYGGAHTVAVDVVVLPPE